MTVDWQAAYGAVLEYLRTQERARAVGVAEDLMHFARINRVQAVMAPYADVPLTAKG